MHEPLRSLADTNENNRPVEDWLEIYRSAIEYVDEGITVYDRDLKLLAWNQRFFSLLEIPLDHAYVGSPFEECVRDVAMRGEYGEGAIDELVRERVDLAYQFVPHCFERERPNGMVLEIRGNPIPGVGFVTVYKDITERKRAEKALQESIELLETRVEERTGELKQTLEALSQREQWTRLVADAVPALIGYVDSGRVCRFFNKRFEEWLGLTADQIMGKQVWEALPNELYKGHENDMNLALSGQTLSREFALKKPDGTTIECNANYLPHMDTDGGVLGYFILSYDVTEQRQTETILRQIQKMEAVGELTGGIAHDFNNLLTIIVGNLALAEEEDALDDDARDMVDAALDSARKGAALVKRLLAFSRKSPLKSTTYDPKQVVSGMAELLRRTLGPSIEIDIHLEGETWTVQSDQSELESAILNMAINSRDAMMDGGTLTISVKGETVKRKTKAGEIPAGDYVLISVSDNGVGMSERVSSRVFEPFFTTKKVGRGTGLGLSMVYGFVRRSGGHVSINSKSQQGTTIACHLPRWKQGAPMSEEFAETGKSAPRGNETVLVVDDEAAVRAFATKVLTGLGYQVVESEDAVRAQTLLENSDAIDLVVTDIEMPGSINGLELARIINCQWPHIKVVLMSGYPDRAMNDLSSRVSDYTLPPLLSKPFEKPDLAQSVRKALDDRA
jgi:PAS domain S-box-containing protein